MKPLILLLLALSGVTVLAQSSVKLPIEMWVTIPQPTNAVNNATNTPQIFTLTNNVIDPSLGPRLIRNFSAPTTFTLGKFQPSGYVTFYYRNVNRTTITWPPGITWLTPPPTNQVRGVVVFEQVLNELWGSALNQ